ncbi:hypothetical protein PoB_005193400 [Plakobranchus ocellatus]|uniref:Uncharacterized protein n=1 Tax=Plakobranchus ocellatus TaxID=259542 RepID=A0AAV4BYX2_9GAST|nr:hypothetical protein PoB_005193400 [Plakobranchus ocellatus]
MYPGVSVALQSTKANTIITHTSPRHQKHSKIMPLRRPEIIFYRRVSTEEDVVSILVKNEAQVSNPDPTWLNRSQCAQSSLARPYENTNDK